MEKLKQFLLTLFFLVHLVLIFFQGINTTIDNYWSFHYKSKSDFPKLFTQNENNELYYILTGINTGYGFYGIKTSSKKYFKISYYDNHNNLILTDRYMGLNSTNGIQRFGGYSSYMANYVADTEKLIKEDSLSDLVKFRRLYITKSMKWLGKKKANLIPNCSSYRVELLTVVPDYYKDFNKKIKLYALQSNLYHAK
ncbi:MAG: hypothetical protein K0R36_951 [Chryseobacterium sp.]|jgi:hypothetical protein|nr:hypothetical protein [Chryseobacterium sp.]